MHNFVQWLIYFSSIILLSYMAKHNGVSFAQHCSCVQIKPKFFKILCMPSKLMYFTGANFLWNNLKGTGDMVIFVLLCKITHSFVHANILITE